MFGRNDKTKISIDEKLLKQSSIEFPRKCILCNKHCEDYVKFHISSGRATPFFGHYFGLTDSFHVRAHEMCGRKARINFYSKEIYGYIFATLIAIPLGAYAFYGKDLFGALLVGFGSVIILAYYINKKVKCPIEIAKCAGSNLKNCYLFTFDDPEYADYFRELNKRLLSSD